MQPELPVISSANDTTWGAAMRDLEAARAELSSVSAGIVRQRVYGRWLEAKSRSTGLLHTWWAETLELKPVSEPRLVFSLDVDGVLEDEGSGFSCTGAAGTAALRLLQLGRVAVLLNTARSLTGVRERVSQFRLLGGVSSFGAAYCDGVYGQESSLLSARGATQLTELRAILRADPELVQDGEYQHSVRASRIVNGRLAPIAGPAARKLLQQHGMTDLTFWVAPEHTDFVDRSVDKGTGLVRLLDELRLGALPIAAMGDASCDVPMLRLATYAFLPAATLPAYVAPRRQRLLRGRLLGENALWEAACHLVPESGLQREVIKEISEITYPRWFPPTVSQGLRSSGGVFPRLKTALVARLTNKEAER